MTAPTSRQLRFALGRVKPASLGVQHRRILDEIAAETIDLNHPRELAAEVSEASIGKRLGMSPATIGKYVDELIKARVVRWWNRLEGGTGRQARWLEIEGNFRRWAVEWSVSETEVYLLLDYARCEHVYVCAQRQVCEHPYGYSQRDGEPPKVLDIRRLERCVVPTSMVVFTKGTVVHTFHGGVHNAPPIRPPGAPLSSLVKESKIPLPPRDDDEDDEKHASAGSVQVRRAIKRLTGQRIFDGPKGAYWSDLQAALDGVDDAGWVEMGLEAQGVTKWWEAVTAAMALAAAGDPTARSRRQETDRIRLLLRSAEDALADARQGGDWRDIEVREYRVTELRSELAACETGREEVAS